MGNIFCLLVKFYFIFKNRTGSILNYFIKKIIISCFNKYAPLVDLYQFIFKNKLKFSSVGRVNAQMLHNDTGTDLEKSPNFYVSMRNTRQRDLITRPTSRVACVVIGSLCCAFLLLK